MTYNHSVNLTTSTSQPVDIAGALVNPHRFAEIRRAISADPQKVLQYKGAKWGESAMHWVGMSDPGNWVDLVAAGGNPNAKDRLGRTPLDWINDRLLMGAMMPHQRLGAPSRDRIRVATIKQVPAVWAAGGRSGEGPHSQNPVKLWIESGLWDLLSLATSEPHLWSGWDDGLNAFHSWVGLADREGSKAVFDRIVSMDIAVDLADNEGRSALWMAVDGWLSDPAHAAPFRAAIESLITAGADPDRDQGASAPSSLPFSVNASEQLQSMIAVALGA